ncbi:MAG: tryptophan synthase subunit beta [Gemmatimonadetes bacterium]|nr:tryptophan synthase subunit beta [Gemmatimonadota bacterium]NIO31478.1 tryptophan synthase subunit beta [Gemmatimonadota bacterium]
MAKNDEMSGNDRRGWFGEYGGRYVPETLVPALDQLEETFERLWNDSGFRAELDALLAAYVGRPTPLYRARRFGELAGGAAVFLKREDLAHTGSHKLNNALGQALLARTLGKQRLIAETGAGQHGVATATVAALLGLPCQVYMGSIDMARQQLNVVRMELLGAEVIPVDSGSKTLKDATSQAIRDWMGSYRDTHYVIGSCVGPHPYPLMVRSFQSVIGIEARRQILEECGRLPDGLVACVGGGSNAIGLFHPFFDDDVEMVGVEAAGEGLSSGRHSASLVAGKPGVLHGSRSFILQDDDGQVAPTHSIAAGLDYPGVGPEHVWLRETGRARYLSVTDDEAMDAYAALAKSEGIIPALESSHALAYTLEWGSELGQDGVLLVNLSGRGDKDVVRGDEEIRGR